MFTSIGRRRLLQAGALGAAGALTGCTELGKGWLFNACLDPAPAQWLDHELVRKAWQGINPANCWDVHAHIAGIGDSDSGITISERMKSLFYPMDYLRRVIYMNAACVEDAPGRVDKSYMERLRALMGGMRPGYKLMLYAFEHFHDDDGNPRPGQSTFHVPNEFARNVARAYPARFEWVASIHPYHDKAVDRLRSAIQEGARGVKWLPAAMNIDPMDKRCVPFYKVLASTGIPLISHGGEEKAVHAADLQRLNNPLRLQAALDEGVRVVVAHCASTGKDLSEIDRGEEKTSFELFESMIKDNKFKDLLFGDFSAVTQNNREIAVAKKIIENTEWHGRLLNGSDYPLPGVLPLFSPNKFAEAGMLDPAAVPVLKTLQEHNPLLFDFVLKRSLVVNGNSLPASVFETRRIFDPAFSAPRA